MKLLVKKNFYYNSEKGLYQCEVTFYLPAKSYGLSEEVKSPRYFLGDVLDDGWGVIENINGKSYRKVRRTLVSSSGLKDLEEFVECFVKARLREIENIVKENRERMEGVPEEETLQEFEI